MSDPAASTLRERLEQLQLRIASAARRAGRETGSVKLLAVSKRQSAQAIRQAYQAGLRQFGENYVQELEEKRAQLADLPELRFHFIGQLQRNKAGRVAKMGAPVHSVDSLRLLEALASRAPEPLPVFIQVNISGEAQKGGCSPQLAPELVEAAASLPQIDLQGLMGVPGAGLSASQTQAQFEALAQLRGELSARAPLPELSLGMSADLELAIAAGSTWVRVGSALFGPRAPAAAR